MEEFEGIEMPINLASEVDKAQEENPTLWMEEYELSQEEIDEMQEAEFLSDSLIISSQVTILAAKPGCGKTTLAMAEMAGIVEAGYTVLYVNMDCGAGDLKYWRKIANDGGFKMITPHFSGSKGIKDWMERLAAMSQLNVDLSKTVIVVDTLKKIADLMSKAKAREAMGLLRALTAKQCTIVCAAHCNKHRTPDGKLMFEGVGDIEADCDNLIYLEGSERDDYGTKTVTSEPSDKVRGIFQKRTWQILEDRTVIALDIVVDVAGQAEIISQLEKDETAIEIIKAGIMAHKHQRGELYQYVKENGVSKREFDTVIKRYCKGKTSAKVTPLWRNEKQLKKDNPSYYVLLDEAGGDTPIQAPDQTNHTKQDNLAENGVKAAILSRSEW